MNLELPAHHDIQRVALRALTREHAPAPLDERLGDDGEELELRVRQLSDETCPVSTEGWTRRVHFVREGGGFEPASAGSSAAAATRAARARSSPAERQRRTRQRRAYRRARWRGHVAEWSAGRVWSAGGTPPPPLPSY